jgi:hypothetical protein
LIQEGEKSVHCFTQYVKVKSINQSPKIEAKTSFCGGRAEEGAVGNVEL